MTAPVLKNRDLRYLLKAFSASSTGRALSKHTAAHQTMALCPAASIAWWIATYHPELAEKPHIELAILGAEDMDALDDGRWYGLIPWMLGKPGLTVGATLVGPSVRQARSRGVGLGNPPVTKVGTPTLFPTESGAFAPAQVQEQDLQSYLAEENSADLYVLFQPGFENFEKPGPQWLKPGQLEALVQRPAPIAVFSYARLEQLTEAWLLSKFGFTVPETATRNPFAGVGEEGNQWASIAWEVLNQPKTGRLPTPRDLQTIRDVNDNATAFYRDHRMFPSSTLGVSQELPTNGEQLVKLAQGAYWACPALAMVYRELNGGFMPAGKLPSEVIESYNVHKDTLFGRAAWALSVSAYVGDLSFLSE